MKKVEVTVCIITYNHEKYIRQCLEGVVNQKTTFPFEVIVHDDASTDNTQKVIHEYCKKYPDLIVPILQTENQYSKGIPFQAKYIYPIARGKYFARCEGDDYWCDNTKLQKQYEALEMHHDCFLCMSRVQAIQESGEAIERYYPKKKQNPGVMESSLFLSLVLEDFNFQLSGFFCRSSYLFDYNNDKPEFAKTSPVGDFSDFLFFGQLGNVYYIQDVMSKYRLHAMGSWTSRQIERSKEKKITHCVKLNETVKLFNEYTQKKYESFCKRYVLRTEFIICGFKENYKGLLAKKYKQIRSELSLKTQVAIFMQAYCYPVYSLIKKIM